MHLDTNAEVANILSRRQSPHELSPSQRSLKEGKTQNEEIIEQQQHRISMMDHLKFAK